MEQHTTVYHSIPQYTAGTGAEKFANVTIQPFSCYRRKLAVVSIQTVQDVGT